MALFGRKVFADVTFVLGRVGPESNMTGVLMRRETQTHGDDAGRAWSDPAASRGAPRTAGHRRSREEAAAFLPRDVRERGAAHTGFWRPELWEDKSF